MEGTVTSEMPGTGEAQKGLRAIVIGSGMAGIQAAAALSRLFQNVIVLERDNVAEARYLTSSYRAICFFPRIPLWLGYKVRDGWNPINCCSLRLFQNVIVLERDNVADARHFHIPFVYGIPSYSTGRHIPSHPIGTSPNSSCSLPYVHANVYCQVRVLHTPSLCLNIRIGISNTFAHCMTNVP
jgi:hypothetical protein